MVRDTNTKSYDIEKAYNNGKYIMTSTTVYQPFYSPNAGYYAMPVYKSNEGRMTRRGRFHHFTGDEVNHIIKTQLLNNL